ncbi:uncharacterized protein LOC143909423 [Arctopsyche grandis]|uniref:uncharacterized protein LOC143909423 n=1 Tax=Arctopsyche grandis TaxID=121162 RepID=UPI00406D6D30
MKLFTLIFIFELIFIVKADECSQTAQNSVINILNEFYTLTTIKIFDGIPPNQLRYYDGDIFYKVNNRTFAIRKDSNKEQLLKYKIIFGTRSSYVDDMGNKVILEKNAMHMNTYNSQRKLRIIPESGHKINQFNVDLDKSRVFFIAYDINFSTTVPTAGRLYAFDTQNPNKVGGRIEVSDIKQLGNKIASIQIDKTSGKSIIAVEISADRWKLCKLESVETSSCKVPHKEGIRKNALEVAIKLAGEQILTMYQEAILGNEKSEILNRKDAVAFPNGGPTKMYLGSQTKPAYDPSAADNFDACGSKFDVMTQYIDKLKVELNTVNNQYEKLYLLVFSSAVMKSLEEFKRSSTDFIPIKSVPFKNVPATESKKYVCVVEEELKSKVGDFSDATSLLSEVSTWLQFIIDSMNGPETQKNGAGIIEARFGE